MNLLPDQITISGCCGAEPTETCNEDTGFCADCRDHTEFIEVCIECSEAVCEHFPARITFTDGTSAPITDGIIGMTDSERMAA